MIDDSIIIPLSALQHYIFCPRQCALVHIEHLWEDNELTVSGSILHQHVDSNSLSCTGNIIRASSLRLSSEKLLISGIADMVEFIKTDSESQYDNISTTLPGHRGKWKPYPIEYKHGAPKSHRADEIQLCAQALCLEEMLNVTIHEGALFYGKTRRRKITLFDDKLKNMTMETILKVRHLFITLKTPEPSYSKRCHSCSLFDLCKPHLFSLKTSSKEWLQKELSASLGSNDNGRDLDLQNHTVL